MISYNNLYQSQGSAVLAALNTPPPALLPVGALASQLNAPVSAAYRPNSDILYSKSMTSAAEHEQQQQHHSALARTNPNLSQLMNFKTEPGSLNIKTEPLSSVVKLEHSQYLVKPEDYKPDHPMIFKTEADHSLMLKPSHDLFEPSPPKAVPVSVETSSPVIRESTPDSECNSDIIQLKPAMAVSHS